MPKGFARLPHVITRADLVALLAPTYAAARSVSEEEARERLEQALGNPQALADVYHGLDSALRDRLGPRTREDAVMDRLSLAAEARRHRVRAAAVTPAISAALVRLDLEIGVAPETMRATLATDRGRDLLYEGLRALGGHLVKQLIG